MRMTVEVNPEDGGVTRARGAGSGHFLSLAFLGVGPGQQRRVSWDGDPVGQSLFTQHLPGGRHQARVVIGVVLRQRRRGVQQRQAVPVGSGGEKRGPALVLALGHGVRERLAFALGEQQDAEHGEHGEGGEDDLVEEVAAVVLELHQGGSGHADAARRQDQAEAPAAARGGRGGVREGSESDPFHETTMKL